MRIVATTEHRTFHFDHADLCAAWDVPVEGWVKAVTDDLVYNYAAYGEWYSRLSVRSGVTYIEEVRDEYLTRKDNVRAAVRSYLRRKFSVRSAIVVEIDGGDVTARCGIN